MALYCSHVNLHASFLWLSGPTRIFEVFQKLHGKEVYAGTGIGLAIVKKIVQNHDGIITATSELNEGATFDIYLPIVEAGSN